MRSVRLVSRYLLTSSFHSSAEHILRRSSNPGSPETKSSKEDDIIRIWEKSQTQLLLMLQHFDSEGKRASFFST